jgi:RNA polymerase sigma factor (sigma-70 family)
MRSIADPVGSEPVGSEPLSDPRIGDQSFDELYEAQWWPMVRLAQALVDDVASAEDVVQDAFAGLLRNWPRLRSPGAALGYLRAGVVNGARSALQRRRTARRWGGSELIGDAAGPAADAPVLLSEEHTAVRSALASLPARQREVLTLRFVADLTDSEIVAGTGMSAGNVRSAASRGMTTLRSTFGGRS